MQAQTLSVSQEHYSTRSVQWRQLFSLTALYASVIIGWIAYEQYQPKLLVQFGLSDLTFALAFAQALILTITPAIAGRIADHHRFTRGHRFPVITTGISFAAMVFMAVAFTLFSAPGEIFRWILPVLILLWLVAMSIFTSPALSAIETFIPVDKLPRAMAVLTITSNLLYALEPVIVDIIDFFGAPLTFVAGGAFVFLTGYFFRKNVLVFMANAPYAAPPGEATASARSNRPGIFLTGVVFGIATVCLFHLFPGYLEKSVSAATGFETNYLQAGILVLSALAAWLLSYAVELWGLRKSVISGFAMAMMGSAGVVLQQSMFLLIPSLILFAVGFGVLSVTSLPLALEKSAFREKVFCVGLFFCGVAFPEAIVEAFLAYRH